MRTIRLRYPATCADCGAHLEKGAEAKYYGRGRIYGVHCHDDDREPTLQLGSLTKAEAELLRRALEHLEDTDQVDQVDELESVRGKLDEAFARLETRQEGRSRGRSAYERGDRSEGARRSHYDRSGVYSSDGTYLGKAGGRCEDAPCCGCCP